MTREELFKALDLTDDGKINLDDVVKLANHNEKKLLWLGIVIGLVVGIITGAILF